jgi:hypothetical protein
LPRTFYNAYNETLKETLTEKLEAETRLRGWINPRHPASLDDELGDHSLLWHKE